MAMAKYALLALALFCMQVALAQEVSTDAAVTVEEDSHRELGGYHVDPCHGKAERDTCEYAPYKSGYCCKGKCQKKDCPPPNPCAYANDNDECPLEYGHGYCCKKKCQKKECPPPNPCAYAKDNDECPLGYGHGYCCKKKCQKKECPPPNPCAYAKDNDECPLGYGHGYCCKKKCKKDKCPTDCKAYGVVDGETACSSKGKEGTCCAGKCCSDTCCGDYKKKCVNTQTDVYNCGSCGNSCINKHYGKKKCKTAKCVYGLCQPITYY